MLAFSFGLALLLTGWLGTPQERFTEEETFAKLGLPSVPVRQYESLAYNRLFFVRLELDDAPRRDFLRSLSDFEVTHGVPEKPISLKLERAWWDPPDKQEGTTWKRGEVTVWNPDTRPDLFYAVLATEKTGGAEESTRN